MTDQAVKTMQIGVSRPPLEIDDLPTPEEVFKVKQIGWKEVVRLVIGPSLIALGLSIGSGEWLLGPLSVATYGFTGIGIVIMISAVMQTFYNVELARFTVATGEVPAVAFGRAPGDSASGLRLQCSASIWRCCGVDGQPDAVRPCSPCSQAE